MKTGYINGHDLGRSTQAQRIKKNKLTDDFFLPQSKQRKTEYNNLLFLRYF